MKLDWRLGLARRLLLVLLAGGLLGLLTGYYGWSMAFFLSVYLYWVLSQLVRLYTWLKQGDLTLPPPEGQGLWGEVFDALYRLQQQDQRALGRLQAVIDRAQESTAALKDAVVVMDSQANLEWCNPAAGMLLGLRDQDSGQPVTNLVRHPAFKEYFERGRYQEPLELPSPVNDQLSLQVTLTRFGNNEHLMVVRDVTRLHRLEQMRKDFVANVSHELRTPLTVIAGYLETLLTHGDDIDPRWAKPLKRMEQQSERMKNLLEDLLLLAKLEATSYPSHNDPVAVPLMLETIRRDACSLSGEQGHRISIEADPELRIKGDEMELRSAFSNLVFNAVKYTPAGGEICIRWWRNDLGAHLAVIDNGPGIDSKHLPRLTERFYRVDASRASNTGGTGLGLAIVKHVLLRHQGRLDIQSSLGKGSQFTCHFPPVLVCTPADARAAQEAEEEDL